MNINPSDYIGKEVFWKEAHGFNAIGRGVFRAIVIGKFKSGWQVHGIYERVHDKWREVPRAYKNYAPVSSEYYLTEEELDAA